MKAIVIDGILYSLNIEHNIKAFYEAQKRYIDECQKNIADAQANVTEIEDKAADKI